MSLLNVKEIVMRFGGITALDHISLELNRGEILGLIGPNGAGKTTLFNVITGVLPPTEGNIYFERRSIKLLAPHQRARRGIARTFQSLQLWPTMSVLENVKLPIDALKKRNLLSDALGLPYSEHAEKAAGAEARAILHVLDLLQYEGTIAGDLPVGVQRRVEIARALAARPKLLLLDEPAAGLDHAETERLGEVLQLVRERFKVSMLLVDHDMSLVMRTCDYIYVLDFGKLLARGRPDEIRNDPRVIAAYLGEAEAELPSDPEDATTVMVADAALHALHEAHESREAERIEVKHHFDAAGAPLLEVTGLAAGYGALEVIRDVNLKVGEGEVVACIGANGAGKTTTLRAISGVIKPGAGRVVFGGEDITGQASHRIVRLGMLHVPQGRGLFPKLTVEDTLRLASYSGHRDGDLSPAYDSFPKLHQRRRQVVGTLSGGEQQMVAMARALLVKPRLLLIDEMSQGLAPAIVNQLFKWLDIFRQEGVAVFLVEQFVDSALAVADRAYIFEHGTIVREAPAAELRRDKNLIASSYLGSAANDEPAVAHSNGHGNGHGNGHHPLSLELMEEFIVRIPPDLKRSIEERAARDGRRPSEIARELLQETRS